MAEVGRVERGQADVHALEGHVTDGGHAVRREVEDRDDGCRQEHDDEGHRDPGVARREEQQQPGDGEADRERRPGHAVPRRVAGERPDVLEERVAGDVDAGHLAQLAGDHDDGDAGHVADQDRPRQQVADEPDAQDAGQQRIQADEQRERCREGGVADRIPRRERREHRGRHQGGGRLRADRQQSRRADQRVEHHRHDDDREPRLRWQSRQRRVRHHLRDEVGRDGDAAHEVAAQVAAVVVQQALHSDVAGHSPTVGPRP